MRGIRGVGAGGGSYPIFGQAWVGQHAFLADKAQRA
jgi:hypothetical protein